METLLVPRLAERIGDVREQWQGISYEQAQQEFQDIPSIEPVEGTSRAYILDPKESEIDPRRSIVLAQSYLQGWTTHHYIRARVAQQVVAPNSRVIVFPNNTRGQQNYDLTKLGKRQIADLKAGSMDPIGTMHLRTLEALNAKTPLGAVALSGYSKGGKSVLSMASLGSDSLDITHVNADEAPSEVYRTDMQLLKDFLGSGGSLRAAVKGSEIGALSSAMRANRMAWDVIRFFSMLPSKDGRLTGSAMTGCVGLDILRSTGRNTNSPFIKLGYVDGSKIFHPDSVNNNSPRVDIVRYSGKDFYKHSSGDNVITHALMVNEGVNPV